MFYKRKYSEHKLGPIKPVWNMPWLVGFELSLAEPCFTPSDAVAVLAGFSARRREVSGTTACSCRHPTLLHGPSGFSVFSFLKEFLFFFRFLFFIYFLLLELLVTPVSSWKSFTIFPLGKFHSFPLPLFSLALPFSLTMTLSILLFIVIASWKNILSSQQKEEPPCRSALAH